MTEDGKKEAAGPEPLDPEPADEEPASVQSQLSRRELRIQRADSRPRTRFARSLAVLPAVAIVALLLIGGCTVWVFRQIDPPGAPGAEVKVTIPSGVSASDVAELLEDAGVVRSATAFRLYVRVKGAGAFQSGEYLLPRDIAFDDLVPILESGPKVGYTRLVIPEGFTLEEIAARVDALTGFEGSVFLDLARTGAVRSRFQPADVQTLEGLVFPDTYHVSTEEDERQLLERMVQRFEQVADEVGIDADDKGGRSPYEVVVIASMVETEAKVAEERPLVAAVITNRLRINMRLQIDATVLYALGRHKTGITNKDLEVDSPFNTYRVSGLPPTPIASPGKAALRAALNPENVDYLYYVLVDPSGRHGFTASAAEFERLKADAKRRGVF